MINLIGNMKSLSGLKVVLLDCPYAHSWQDARMRDLFGRVLQLKLSGYLQEYPFGTLPIDTTDFITTHVLICRETDLRLEPIFGFKCTSLERSKLFHLEFPGLTVTRTSDAPDHHRALQQILSRCEREGTSIAYMHGWTMLPEVRKDADLRTVLRELIIATHVLVQQQYQIPEATICGSLRFKTHQLEIRTGHRPLRLDGRELPSFQQRNLNNEPVLMLHLEKFSEEGLALADKYRFFWEQRLTLAQPLPSAQEIQKKAA